MKANELLKRIEAKTAPVIIDPRSEIEFKKGAKYAYFDCPR